MTGEHGEYEVIGRARYRGHDPGTVFQALIEPRVEQRGVARGNIRLLRRIPAPDISDCAYALPDGWLPEPPGCNPDMHHDEAPEGASTIERR